MVDPPGDGSFCGQLLTDQVVTILHGSLAGIKQKGINKGILALSRSHLTHLHPVFRTGGQTSQDRLWLQLTATEFGPEPVGLIRTLLFPGSYTIIYRMDL